MECCGKEKVIMLNSDFENYKATLRKVQLVQLEILKEIDAVCKKNNIQYFLDSGTLLGAVRHRGFIPWDDDLDIGMTRENYEKFLKIANHELDEHFYCLNWHEYDDYGLSFAKVKKKNTLYVENVTRNSIHSEIFVDVFPYDRYPATSVSKYLQGYPLLLLRVLIKLRAGNIPWAGGSTMKKIKYFPVIVASKMFPAKWMIRLYEKTAQRYNSNDDYEWYFPQGISRYGAWVLRREWLDNVALIRFEDGEFPGPKDVDSYLKHAYGNYMQLPPEEKRWNRHQILDVKFDEE